ncbi:mRNA-capping enzyme subunit beta [Lignoscripta atroalba]|nr:mRNA-capping enzyme subunit beta [Lignoscripta atroalba]
MDLSSIINSDNSNSSAPTRPPPNLASPVKQSYLQNQQIHHPIYEPPSSGYQGPGHTARPPQPPPLQPPAQRDLQSPSDSVSLHSAQSPYQYTPTSSRGGSQYPFPQNTGRNSANGSSGPAYTQREHSTTVVGAGSQSYGQPSPSLFAPTTNTPGSIQNYIQYPRPQSSHSSTPTSAQSHMQSFPRESPHSKHSQIYTQTQPYPSQPYPSQPGTPLGPPPPIGRPSSSLHRETSGSYPYDHHRTQSGSSLGNSQALVHSPTNEAPSSFTDSPTTYGSRHPSLNSRSYLADQDRERSLSVSPKTRLPSQTKIESVETVQDSSRSWSGQITPAKRKVTEPLPEEQSAHQPTGQAQRYDPSRSIPSSANGGLNGHGATEHTPTFKELLLGQGPQRTITLSPTMTSTLGPAHLAKEFDRSTSQRMPSSGPSSVASSRHQQTSPQPPSNHQTPPSQTSPTPPSTQSTASTFPPPAQANLAMQQPQGRQERLASPASASSQHQPTRKRPRHEEAIPIYAQKASRGNPLLPNKRPPASKRKSSLKHEPAVKHEPIIKHEPTETKSHMGHQVPLSIIKDETNGHSIPINDIALPKPQPDIALLGPWEPTILNIWPHDEVARVISDFLFHEVVNRDDVGAGPAGGGPGQGAVLEIEAKIGQLIDRNTNDRLRLPVMTECVVSKDDPNVRINFKSSMTEAQHRFLNGFLNKALLESKGPPSPANPPEKPRIAMSYVHTRECDSFYELSQSGQLCLPASIRAQLNPRHNKAKVRITTDQKTGRVLAKIVKARVADIDVHSPRTAFDWRVSVNLEMNFDGDMKDLVEVQEGQRRADRNKDRMSYRHLAYQIDLTQVTPTEATSKADKEHELEIEVSSAEVRRQGLLAKTGKISQYEDLVKGFVDNVRILARHCQ